MKYLLLLPLSGCCYFAPCSREPDPELFCSVARSEAVTDPAQPAPDFDVAAEDALAAVVGDWAGAIDEAGSFPIDTPVTLTVGAPTDIEAFYWEAAWEPFTPAGESDPTGWCDLTYEGTASIDLSVGDGLVEATLTGLVTPDTIVATVSLEEVGGSVGPEHSAFTRNYLAFNSIVAEEMDGSVAWLGYEESDDADHLANTEWLGWFTATR